MTTNFLDYQICTFKIILSWLFPRKTSFWGDFLFAPHCPPSKPQKCIFIVVVRLTSGSQLLQFLQFRVAVFGPEGGPKKSNIGQSEQSRFPPRRLQRLTSKVNS